VFKFFFCEPRWYNTSDIVIVYCNTCIFREYQIFAIFAILVKSQT